MATYKVIQDIEAEDKLVGPLTLRQFIYAGIVIMLGFIAWQLARVSPVIASPLLLPILFFAALAAPLGGDQPSEVWLLAKIRFFLKPRRRIWNQDGVNHLVTITAPKRVERHLTNGLTQTEVESRLSALANTLDSRGWAVKNVNVNMYGQAGYLTGADDSSDRLVSPSSLPQAVPMADVTPWDDIMDETTNPTAQHLTQMMQQAEQTHRKQVIDKLHTKTAPTQPEQPADYWFMNQNGGAPAPKPGFATFDHNPLVSPGQQGVAGTNAGAQSADEQALLNQIHKNKSGHAPSYGHMKTILPMGSQPKVVATTPPKPVEAAHKQEAPKPKNPDIIRLAKDDNLSVATLAREAKQGNLGEDEVVVSLH